MNNHANIFGASGKGKTWAICSLAAQMESAVILLDPQYGGAGEELANVYRSLDIPYQHEVVGGGEVLPMDFLPNSSGEEFEFRCESLRESIAAHRGQESSHSMPLILAHVDRFLSVMNETGLTPFELEPAWFNGDVFLDRISDPKDLAWLAQTPNPGSMAGRDRLPAKRFLSILLAHEISRRFQKQFTVPDLLNDGNNLIVSAGSHTTIQTMSFYINHLILAIVNAKIEGKIKTDITIIYEESELAGISTMLAKMVMAVRKFGIGIWFVSQNGRWKSEPFNATDAIWNSCDTTIAFGSQDPGLLDRIANTIPIYTPDMPKFIKTTPRSILTGFKDIQTENKTFGKHESVTEGVRQQGIYRFFQDVNINFMSVTEQKELFKKAITKLNVGQALIKCGDQISIKQFPPLGKLHEKELRTGFTTIQPQSSKYFRPGLEIQNKASSDTSKNSTQGFDPKGLW